MTKPHPTDAVVGFLKPEHEASTITDADLWDALTRLQRVRGILTHLKLTGDVFAAERSIANAIQIIDGKR